MLHAHLPYIRYPEHESFLEENWLYEAITETYIPLLNIFENLLDDGVDFRICLSMTPTLTEMLRDELLMDRYQRHLHRLIELSEREIRRNRRDIDFRDLAIMYRRRFLKIQDLFENRYRKDLITAFRELMESGTVEIATSAATHAYLPALMSEPFAVRAQLHVAAVQYRKCFSRAPSGIWLPECGFTPDMEPLIKDAGLGYFFLESHGVITSNPESRKNLYTPVRTPSGITVFPRDALSSRQVWSAHTGYPGNAAYRDFYRDIGFDLDLDYLKPYLPDGIRTFTGIKYFRITNSRSDRKKPYQRQQALRKAKEHASHFLKSRERQILSLDRRLKDRPLITAAFDAELFGHWWFEGPEWLSHLLRSGSAKRSMFRFTTPSEFIAENPASAVFMPSLSSWGGRGYSATWVDPSNSWIYRHLHRAAKRMREMSEVHRNARGMVKRALNQAARELLLSQASDWSFMMQKERASAFAQTKFTEHMTNFSMLSREIASGRIRKEHLALLEQKNNLFPDIDFRIYAG